MPRLISDEELLYMYAKPGRGYTDTELAEYFEVGRDAIWKRRKRFRDEQGFEFIETERGRYRIDDKTFLSNLRVSRPEALALYVAARRLSRSTRLSHKLVQSALDKLAIALYQPMTEKLVNAAAKSPEHPDAARHESIVNVLVDGWLQGIKVKIRYQGLKATQAQTHIIEPYLIEPSPWSDSVYVIAFSNVFEKVSAFKLERIQRASLTTERYTVNENFSDDTLFDYSWGIWNSDKPPQLVRLRFTEPVAIRRVQESIWHPRQEIHLQPDGTLIWQAEIAEPREMLPWIRGWGSSVMVLAPEWLKQRLVYEAEMMMKMYHQTETSSLTQQYYAHTKDGTGQLGWQLLKDHLTATAKLAADLAKPAKLESLAYIAGLLHDIGKYSREFQERLRGNPKPVDHATAGAREIVKLFPAQQENYLAELISYCIAGHHTGLPNYGSAGDMEGESTLLARREKKHIPDYSAYRTEIDPHTLQLRPLMVTPVRFRLGDKEQPHAGFSIAFMTRMLFSTLVDADWLDTERFMDEEKPRGQYASISDLTAQFNRFLNRFDNPTTEINRRRTETLHACVDKAAQPPGFFTLTVPTGGGKTFASMAFALNHAVAHGLRRVIYVIPFTSIIEQNAGKFREALGPLGAENVLEHHSNFDWEAAQERDDETNQVSQKLKLAAENWDIPIVVTTSVQFFESLFASKKRPARKLHNIARSVIIFDEVQTLPRDYLKPSLLAVQELVRNYGCTTVFCTATQPALERFFPKDIAFTELVPDPKALYHFYRRVKVQNLGELTDDDLLERLNQHEQALCIVNTRRHAKGLYERLAGEGNFHLSTLMCPVHRREVLKEIRRRLREGEPCRVVSTSVMEAGIDVDFPVGYRALAGLDSIIQAAGRVNREMKREHGEMFVFTPKTEFIRRTPAFIAQTGAVAHSTLKKHTASPDSLEAIADYYKLLYALQDKDAFDVHRIVKYFEKSQKHPDFDFKTAAENFRFIQQDSVSVLIPYDEQARKLIEQLQHAQYPTNLLRKLQVYTVNIYEREFKHLQSKGIIWTISEHYHALDEGRMADFYHPMTGLLLPDGSGGDAIFFDG